MNKRHYNPNIIYSFKYILLFMYFLLIFLYNFCFAQPYISPASFDLKSVSYLDNKATLLLEINIEEGWKVYAYNPGESGLPLKITINHSNNIKSYQVIWPEYKVYKQEGISTNIYDNQVVIPIEIIPVNNEEIRASMNIEYGACKDICTSERKQISFNIIPNYTDPSLIELCESLKNKTEEIKIHSFFSILIFAFLGGFILNLMPCVLPVLSLKVFSVLKNLHSERGKIKISLISTILGILFSFILLASFTQILKNLGHNLGWGFHFQEPGFIIFLIVILLIFALNLYGLFEIKLPQAINNLFNKPGNDHSNAVGSFFSGILATLLATPCTAPFLSVAVAFGLSQNFISLIIIYLFIGIGMALPYISLLLRPNLLRFLPRPGAWMLKLKKVFACLLLLTATWLAYVLYSQLTLQNNEIESLWETFSEEKIEEYINQGHIVLVDVTAEWCLICKMNKYSVLEDEKIKLFLQKEGVKLIRADYTNRSSLIRNFLNKNGRFGIPFNIIFSPNNPTGLILPEILTKSSLYNAIKSSKRL